MILTADPPPRSSPIRPLDASRAFRIAVADDDTEFRELVAGALREDGHDIVEDSDGGRLLVRLTATYALGATPIDLIVSDVCMPICSGLDILKRLRRANWSTPVILMTGFGDGDLRASASYLGAILLEKPFDTEALKNMVREQLLRPRMNDSASMGAP